MALKLKSGFFLQLLVLLMAVLVFFGCASIQKPMGGPRDRTPPKLLLATPLNETRNFKATSIKLDFDEYFKLSSQYQEITMSPALDKALEFKVKGKSLLINFKDTLQKNTTYVINFGKAIVDVNEGNVLKNFTYVFSTGPHIDSLSISGTVTNTQTQQKEKDATVMLFTLKQDSLLFGKKKPAIYATTDSSGNFTLGNLHDGDYRIYALKEASPNKIYDNENELIAFLKKPLHITKDTSNIQLTLFKQAPESFRVVSKNFDPDGKMSFVFNMPLTDPGVKINYPPNIDDQKLVDFSRTKDSAQIYLRNMDFDSISVSFTDKGKPLDTVYLRKGRKEAFTRTINLTYNINNDSKLKPGADLNIYVNSPIESFDPSRIILLEDSVSRTNFTLTKDPVSAKKFTLKYRWRQLVKYQIAFNEGTFVNIYGDKNKRLVKNFSIDKPENYGSIALKVTVPDSTGKSSYVIELLNEQKVAMRKDVITKNTTLNYKDYPAGKYQVRITYDTNGNGRWDSGNVKKKLYPEQIVLIPTLFTLRPNWEAEDTVEVPKEVATP
ncbi:Ig-like domain-containing protein [Mucilaginibacter boryungensis]|uniref:Ig-like domain-containing protein n=1 Tax=Mucilaginibacter boryungensis TaxID=768480 RepID=A0ABR9XME2_9SPHI|nr:Ig-like domain-containing protein [Mucilaginibacter boryungensis]MBE9668558.1 Ig-like domain-containing protein [Mucilaginibacter boryungensis]